MKNRFFISVPTGVSSIGITITKMKKGFTYGDKKQVIWMYYKEDAIISIMTSEYKLVYTHTDDDGDKYYNLVEKK